MKTLASALDLLRPDLALIIFGAIVACGASAQTGFSTLRDSSDPSGNAIYASLFFIQAVFALFCIGYTILVWSRSARLGVDRVRKSLGGVVKWEIGWLFLFAVGNLTQFLARTPRPNWESLDATLLTLIMIGLVVSGGGDMYTNWPIRTWSEKTETQVATPRKVARPSTAKPAPTAKLSGQ